MYAHVIVCTRTYTHAYTHTHTHSLSHAHTHSLSHIHTHAHTHTHIHTAHTHSLSHTHTYTHTLSHTHTHIHTYTHTHSHIHTHIVNTVSPDQAYGLSVESVESTSISITWQPPTLTSIHVLYYIINADNLNSSGGDNNMTQVNTTNNAEFVNVTDLLPGTTYELTVVAVSEDIIMETVSMSQPSSSVVTTTGFTGILH